MLLFVFPNFSKSTVVQYCHSVNEMTEKKQKDLLAPIDQPLVQNNLEKTGEAQIINQFVASGNTVFDVGANVGVWTKEVLKKYPDTQVHLFEPVPHTYHLLLKNLSDYLRGGNIFPNNIALAGQEIIRHFNFYQNNPTLSTFYRRLSVEQILSMNHPELLPVLLLR